MGAEPGATALADAYAHAAGLVRDHDRDRYLGDLFAPEAVRPHLLALHAFNVEVARIRDLVSDPTLGEIRLQWWRDAIVHRSGGGHPVATALLATIDRFRLPTDPFVRLIDARVFDLYDDPMPTLNDLEGYAGDTSSSLIHLGAMMLAGGNPGTANAAGYGGVAYALTGLLRALPIHARRHQCYLPKAMMVARSVDEAMLFAGRTTPELLRLLADLRTIARQHAAEARRELTMLDPLMRPAFLPLALVGPYLDRMDRPNYDPFIGIELPAWRRQWILWRAARAM